MRVALAAMALLLVACAGPGPVVDATVHDVKDHAMRRVAVVPFSPTPQLARDPGPEGIGGIDAANLVARMVSEAFAAAGFDVIAPSDLIVAFEGAGQVIPRQDVAANARRAASDFGATAVVIGKVMRYREREGSAAGALRPASVHYEVAIYGAPGGALLYTGRFDQTQQALSANPLLARKYPGGGTRWLTAAEMARWGADEIVATLPVVLK